MPEIKPTCLCATAALAIVLAATPAIAWEPNKPVEIVVAAGAGGASDQMARMMQSAIQKNNLMKQPVVVSLKGGASGAEALIYMKSSEGDPNKMLIAYSLIYMLPLSAKIPFNWRDLTPVAVIALDQFVLWVNTQLPYKSVKEFADAAKAASPPLKMGGTGSRREDHVLTVFMEKKTGAKFAYLPYKSGGEAATQLVGNHTASNVNNPSENLEVWRAGQARALCVFDKERIEYKTKVTTDQSWNDIPTCKDQGLDVEYLMLRAIFLPGKVTAGPDGVLRRPDEEVDADGRIQGLHGETGAQADLPHRQGHAQVPGGGRYVEQEPDDRGRICRELGPVAVDAPLSFVIPGRATEVARARNPYSQAAVMDSGLPRCARDPE